ncbi:MAG TPA: Holliday junction branch migration protein RuvA [Dehalococcoidia bacterium]|nr:Holliday junction branch migration protein RuvA [Dehalococcoidia bacterium]
MIAGLKGILEWRGDDGVVVRVGGVSLRVHVPTSTLSRLGSVGDEVELHTHLYIREDQLALYGFATPEELSLFQVLIGVSGVGPRSALGMLSAVSPEELSLAIASGNVEVLAQLPGVGKKMAGRLVVELRGKLERGWVGVPIAGLAQDKADVVAALTSLGYSTSEAMRAVSALPDDPGLALEDKVRLALQGLAKG